MYGNGLILQETTSFTINPIYRIPLLRSNSPLIFVIVSYKPSLIVNYQFAYMAFESLKFNLLETFSLNESFRPF